MKRRRATPSDATTRAAALARRIAVEAIAERLTRAGATAGATRTLLVLADPALHPVLAPLHGTTLLADALAEFGRLTRHRECVARAAGDLPDAERLRRIRGIAEAAERERRAEVDNLRRGLHIDPPPRFDEDDLARARASARTTFPFEEDVA